MSKISVILCDFWQLENGQKLVSKIFAGLTEYRKQNGSLFLWEVSWNASWWSFKGIQVKFGKKVLEDTKNICTPALRAMFPTKPGGRYVQFPDARSRPDGAEIWLGSECQSGGAEN